MFIKFYFRLSNNEQLFKLLVFFDDIIICTWNDFLRLVLVLLILNSVVRRLNELIECDKFAVNISTVKQFDNLY